MHQRTFALLLVALACAPIPASAAILEFTPFAGQFSPTSALVISDNQSVIVDLQEGPVYGGRLTWWLSPRFGAEALVAVAQGDLDVLDIGTHARLNARNVLTDVRGRVRLNAERTPVSLDLIAGVGMTNLGGGLADALEEVGVESPAVVTFVIGLGGTIPVGEHLKLSVGVESRFHEGSLDPENLGASDRRSQNDILVSLGIAVPVSLP
jgi:hypothetical protein